MKKVKQANGYSIYQALTERDAENYGCSVGNYNIYTAQDIRDYGLAYSYAQWDDIDSLATALELCNGSNYAIACALADEISDSTIQDMDLILEIERCLDSGETIEHFCDRFDRDTCILYPTREACEAARDDAALADDDLDGDLEDIFEEALSAGDRADRNLDYNPEETELLCRAMRAAGLIYDGLDSSDGFIVFDDWNICFRQSFESWPEVRAWLEGVVFDDPEVSDSVERILHPEHFASQKSSVDHDDLQDYLDRNYEDPNEVFSCSIDEELRQEVISGLASSDRIDEIENVGIWGVAVLELGNADIEVNVTHEENRLIAEYFVCLKESTGDWYSWGYIDHEVTIDWSAPNWRELLRQEMRLELRRFVREQGWNLDEPMDSVIDAAYGPAGENKHWAEQEAERQSVATPVKEDEPRSHASYYVIETCDPECQWLTCTVARPAEYTDNQYRALFFWRMAERVAFSDCCDDCLEEIVFDGEPCVYTGWQPGMLIEFRSCETGEIVYSNSFPEWDH